jgi:AcrR family transcriptional regulator
MSASTKRPAHRPSRRAAVVEAAMTLYAVRRIEEVTVADIAEEASMTSAAVYYHYPSKEDVLVEGLRQFAEGMTGQLGDLLEEAAAHGGSVGQVVASMVGWVEERRAAGLVWFVTSPGVNESVEALRRETRLDMVEAFRSSVTASGSAGALPHKTVSAMAIVVLFEQASTSALTEDEVYANLGPRRFAAEIISLADLIASGDGSG